MGKKELAEMVEAYAAAKISGNKYLIKMMVDILEVAFDEIFSVPFGGTLEEKEGGYVDDSDQA